MEKESQDIIEKEKMKKKPPIGVKLISIMMYTVAGISLKYALGMLVGGKGTFHYSPSELQILGLKASWIFLLIWDFIWCALLILIGRGLWKGINFVRYIVIVLSIEDIVTGILQSVFHPDAFVIFSLVIKMILNITIIFYLLNKNTTKYFRNIERKNETE